jgi:hypothetical protein
MSDNTPVLAVRYALESAIDMARRSEAQVAILCHACLGKVGERVAGKPGTY